MQLLLGLFFFSILVTTSSSLQCVNCVAINGHCSDVKTSCPSRNSVCMSMKLKSKDNKNDVIVKGCDPKPGCEQDKNRIGQELPPDYIKGVPFETVVRSVECSRAPPSFAPFFPAFLGLLLMKLLF